MQTIIANLIKKFSKKNKNKKEQAIYLQGIFDGMQILCDQLKENLIDINEEKTDPAFAHNWNYIINTLINIVNSTINEAYKGIPESMKEENEINSRNK